MKKGITLFCLTMFMTTVFCATKTTFDTTKAITDTGKKTFTATSAIDTVKDMKTGWNLGNTFDAIGRRDLSSETSWSQPKTTKPMIDGLAKSGIKTIRIPVSWSNHIIDDKYTIDPLWMKRVKEVVDWAISNDMYVILNTHHDNYEKNGKMNYGGGYYPTTANYEESSKFLCNVWAQISLAFNNGYDQHLIFETLNEPRPRGTSDEWNFNKNSALGKESAEIINKFNQDILDTIRASGGNNAKRFVSCPGLAASPNSALADAFEMPKDTAPGKLIVSVHMYTPYNFAMESPGLKSFTPIMGSEIATIFKKLNTKFIENGYPVIIGEYGATNKNNLEARVSWFHFFLKYSRMYGMTSCLWDNGVWLVTGNDYSEHYGYYNRKEQKWFFPEIIEAIREETK